MNHKMITSLISALVVITIDVACSVEQEWTMFHLTGRDAVLFVLFSFSFLFYIYIFSVFVCFVVCVFVVVDCFVVVLVVVVCVCVVVVGGGCYCCCCCLLLLLLFRGVVVFVIIVSFRSCGLWTVHCLAILPLHCFLLQCNGL